jgi:LysR family transcriptional regulator, benzoate and cis,cis-muconate-responsive activator of ben and cat genes
MELRHLRYFTAVAAHGSFLKAARMLHVTQPAVSRQVRVLEEELGATLLVRSRQVTKLTEAGEALYEEARDLLAQADRIASRVKKAGRSEVLRVGYAPSFVAGIMPAALAKFHLATPSVRVELSDLSSREMIELAQAGRIDMVITPDGSPADVPSFQWLEFRRVQPVLVMPLTHPLARLKRISPSRLRDLPLVGLARDNFPEYLPFIRSILRPHGIAPQFVSLEADGVSTVFAALEANQAAAIFAEGIANILPRNLITRPFFPALTQKQVMIGFPLDKPSSHADDFARILCEVERSKTRHKS